MPESFSSGMKAVLDAAQDEAKRLGYGYVSTEHLLLGLIREADGLVAEVFASLAIGLEGARAQVLNVTGAGIQPPESGSIPLTRLSRQVLERAASQARKFHASGTGQEHLLQALIMEISGETARVLTRLGSGPAAIRDRYVQLAGLSKPAARSIRVPPGPLFERLTDGYRKVVNRAVRTRWVPGSETAHPKLTLAGVGPRAHRERYRTADAAGPAMRGVQMPFVQIIEFTTSRFGEVEPLMEDWVARTEGKRSASRSVITRDQDRPNTYVQVVEFPSYEAAMANSGLPETQQVAERLTALCDAPPAFRNLDLLREDKL